MNSKTPPASLVFDWGNTVMTEIDEFNRLDIPMVEWPRVEAIPGIETALSSLHAYHRIFVGTNAEQSTASQVNQALQRVGWTGTLKRSSLSTKPMPASLIQRFFAPLNG